MTPIRPDLLAGKLEAARNGEPEASAFAQQLADTPRLAEALWFLEWAFRQPGGGPRFVDKLIEACPARFQTKSMQAAGPPRNGRYTLAQCWKAWEDFEQRDSEWRLYNYSLDADKSAPKPVADKLSFEEWLPFHFEDGLLPKAVEHDPEVRKGVDRFNWPFLRELCLAAAQNKLPRLLSDWCEEKSMACGGPWYCPDLLPTLFDFMDRHAAEAARQLAETEVTKIVFRELEFARSQKVPVPIIGASRFGKTTAVSVWCEMRPGLARLVTVPDSNRERDFYAAHADPFGLQYNPSTSTAELKRTVEYVHRNSGLFLVYDEAHFLVPTSYHKATPPRRLNWIRCQVIDRGLGCAFFATPQSYRETLAAYVKKTGYCMEQWLGRLAPPVVLPESLPAVDVQAVARKHFPDVPDPYLKLISARALQSEGYLKNMELTVKRARFLASERRHKSPTLEDVKDAIADMMPGFGLDVQGAEGYKRRAVAPREVRRQPAPSPQGGRGDDFSGLLISPQRRPSGVEANARQEMTLAGRVG